MKRTVRHPPKLLPGTLHPSSARPALPDFSGFFGFSPGISEIFRLLPFLSPQPLRPPMFIAVMILSWNTPYSRILGIAVSTSPQK